MEEGDATDVHPRLPANGYRTPPPGPGAQSVPGYGAPVAPPSSMSEFFAASRPAADPGRFASDPHVGSTPALRVMVRLTDGHPVPAAAVTLLDHAGHQLAHVESDANGIAEFRVGSAGELLLVVRSDGHLPQARTVLLHSQPAPPVEVEVVVAAAARLFGTVTNASGRAIEGALVTLTGAAGVVVASARTGPDGRYELADLTAEGGTLAVFARSAHPTAIPVAIAPQGRTRQDVELRGTGVISGRAQTPAGWLIADARVSLHADGVEVAVTRTDADGQYSFTGLDAGTYTITAVGYPPAQIEAVADHGETTAEPITLAYED